MSIHIFTSEEINALSSNPCVRKCTKMSISYTSDFKKRALELHAQGVSSKEIWRRSGFNINGWKNDYTRDCLKNWKKSIKKNGHGGLTKTRGVGGGRPKTKGLTDADKIKRLELQVKYLKAENDFLAKLRAKRAE